MLTNYEENIFLEKELEALSGQKLTFSKRSKALKALKKKYQSDTSLSHIDYCLLLEKKRMREFLTAGACGFGILLVIAMNGLFFALSDPGSDKPDQETLSQIPETKGTGYEEWTEDETASEELYLQAIADFESGNYEIAGGKFKSLKKAGWDGYVVYQYLADCCYKTGDVLNAAALTADYLRDIYGAANIQSRNVLYQRLLSWLKECPEEFQEQYADFLKQAEYYSRIYEELSFFNSDIPLSGKHRRLEMLKEGGADNALFYELYAYYLTIDSEHWDYYSARMKEKDSYHGRQMTYEERFYVLNQLATQIGTEVEVPPCPQELEASEFSQHEQEYQECGLGLADIDPTTGKDINGKVKNLNQALTDFQTMCMDYDYIRENPYLQWPGTYYFLSGEEVYRSYDPRDMNIFSTDYEIEYYWMEDALVQQFSGDGDKDRLGDQITSVVINCQPCNNPQTLVGNYKPEIGDEDDIADRELSVSAVKEGEDGSFQAEIAIFNGNNELFPYTWLTFKDNRCRVNYNGWDFVLQLGRTGWYNDTMENRKNAKQTIDAIVLEEIDSYYIRDKYATALQGIYLKK